MHGKHHVVDDAGILSRKNLCEVLDDVFDSVSGVHRADDMSQNGRAFDRPAFPF